MAGEKMKLKKIVREDYFYPEWMDNKKADQKEQIKVNIKSWPSGAQVGTYKKFSMDGGKVNIDYDDVSMMINHIDNIENLNIGDDLIDNAVKLCDYPDSRLYGLIVEIRNRLLKESEDLSEGE